MALAVLGLVTSLGAAACRDAPEDKIRNWPGPSPSSSAAAPADAQASAAAEVRPLEAQPPAARADNPCDQLIELACSYFGEFSDDCSEARATRPDGTHPETRLGCANLVARFVEVEESERVNPCRRYSRQVCRVLGSDTPRCRRSREVIPRLRSKDGKRACLGDLLMWEARTLRR